VGLGTLIEVRVLGGAVARRERGSNDRPGGLPAVTVLEITGVDADGELRARATATSLDGHPPIVIPASSTRGGAPDLGERVLARLSRRPDGTYEGRIMRRLPSLPRRMVGRLERIGSTLRVGPLGERPGSELTVSSADAGGARPGELVVAERVEGRPLGAPAARVVERLGTADDPAALSLLTAHEFDLPLAFPPEAEALAAAATAAPLGRREDLRPLALVTIDGADARDFDDAVVAAPDPDPANPAGWRVTVAIADVAHYVRPNDALDRTARARGNSVYFPDRVLPMLPARLSDDLCSLRPDEDRACMAVHMRLDAEGNTRGHRFVRGLMRSRARLTYEQVQHAFDGAPDGTAAPLLDPVIRPLFAAYRALRAARRRRGALDLDLPEVIIRLGEDGRSIEVAPQPRLDSHRLIEELMIAANVAAAETLEEAARPCMYRVHDRPDPVKLEALGQLVKALGLVRSTGDLANPRGLGRLLERVAGEPLSPTISDLILRAQSQAVYSPRNIGHFGLALGRYAHFTSPIRRYADLVVHRALIHALGLGEDGDPGGAGEDWRELGNDLSHLERRAVAAERTVRDRFVAFWLEGRVGSSFAGTVSGVTRAGLFVRLDDSLAEGLVPISTLGREYFLHDPGSHRLVGQDTGTTFGLGDELTVELAEVDPLAGRLSLRLLEHRPGPAAHMASPTRRSPRSGRTTFRHGRPKRR
jgi:ribonuclease R